MAIGSVSDIEFEAELKRLEKSTSIPTRSDELIIDPSIPMGLVIDPKELGRGLGKENTPEPVREAIAELAIEGAPAKVLQDAFGISPSSISAYKNGATSTSSYDKPHPPLNGVVLNTKQKIAKIATRKLRTALNSISDEKLRELSPVKAAQVAKDMSAIVRDMSGDGEEGNKGVQVIFFSPRVNDKQSYERVIAHE